MISFASKSMAAHVLLSLIPIRISNIFLLFLSLATLLDLSLVNLIK
jgi:hypothetical protein